MSLNVYRPLLFFSSVNCCVLFSVGVLMLFICELFLLINALCVAHISLSFRAYILHCLQVLVFFFFFLSQSPIINKTDTSF